MKRFYSFLLLALVTSACADRSDRSLPGGSVDRDGGIHLSPPQPNLPGSPRAPSSDAPGPIESQLFTADLIMANQSAIGLEPAQREAIDKEVKKAESDLVDLQWKLQSEKEGLVGVLSADAVDEKKVAEAAERVMAKEHDVKNVHLMMLVRIKNVLKPEQQVKLRKIREEERCPSK